MNVDGGVVHFRVLGPLSVEQEGTTLSSITALMLRRLLAGLLIRPNECVSVHDLISALWGQSAPPAARRTLLVYIRRLRTALGDETRIFRAPAGYRIVVHDGELDCVEFGHLVSNARAAIGKRAADLLSEALKLWRGNAYEDVREHSPIADEARRLDEERVQAEGRYAEVKLELGQHAELIPRLTKLVEAHPFNEDFRRHLMLALYRCGRQTDALELYRSTRSLLDEELGVEPSLALQRMHERILRSDTSLELTPHPVDQAPRELPADIPTFVGRIAQLRALDEMLSASAPVMISAIDGSAGIGKTALALHWAHSVVDRFPDGQLYINLRGFDPTCAPMAPQNAIRRCLETFGFAPQRIPADAEAQAALYRSVLADKRILVVLDNAHDAEQVRPLLPGTSQCLVLLTSRKQLTSLVVTNGARPLMLDVLTADEAKQLLSSHLGSHRIMAEAEATEEIIARCARLPLALAITAARATARPLLSLSGLATELGEARKTLDPFGSDDPLTDLRAVFSWSYEKLSTEAARVFRLLGVHPGPDASASAISSLVGLSLDQLDPLLTELTQANLISKHTYSRYIFHDLLRAYANELAHLNAAESEFARHRMLEHYLHTAHAADRQLNPQRIPIDMMAPQLGVVPEQLVDHDQAMAWFTIEHSVLLSLSATRHSNDLHIWKLAWALVTFLDRQGHWEDLAATQTVALSAAERLADPALQAIAQRGIAAAYFRQGLLDYAETHFKQAINLCERLHDDTGQAQILHNLGVLYWRQERYAAALNAAKKALNLYQAIGNGAWHARGLNAVGWYHAQLGDYPSALIYCEQALAQQQELADHDGLALTLDSLGFVHRNLGDDSEAVTYYQQAYELLQESGDRYSEADTLGRLGDAHQALGDHAAAHQAWQRALDILIDLDHADAARVHIKLEANLLDLK